MNDSVPSAKAAAPAAPLEVVTPPEDVVEFRGTYGKFRQCIKGPKGEFALTDVETRAT
jgi:hypothetical protein